MKFKFILLLFIAFTQNLSLAFSTDYKLSGTVLDSLSESLIANATVQLQLDNIVIKSTLSKDDGSFNISVNKIELYTLIISHIGYKTQIIPIKIEKENQANINVKLQIEGVDLNEISVKANKPLVFQKNGEITYQIEGGIWQNSGNAMSIINRIPILKGRSGAAYLLYGTKVTFLLDGKPIESEGITLENILANLGTNEIDKIEILQSPPPSLARFGKPIVNIKTIKMKEDGSLFNLSHGYSRGINNRFNNGIKYSLKQNNLLFGLSFTQNQLNQLSKSSSVKASSSFNYNDSDRLNSTDNIFNLKLNGEYSAAKFGAFNFSAEHKIFNNFGNKTSSGNYSISTKIENINLISKTNSKGIQNLAGLDYNKKFTEIFNIKSSFEIGEYDINNSENFTLNRNANESYFTNPWRRKILFKNYYLENESKIGNVKITEGLFLKKSESITHYIQNVGTENSANNSFNYLENNFSAFLSSNYSKNKVDFSLELNLEKTDIEGVNSQNTNSIKFYSFLPNLSVNYKINDAKTLTFNYNRGISRPNYEWLNQQELYRNPYTKSIGGGVLLPTIFNMASISSTFENGFTLTGIFANQKNRYSFFPLLATNHVVEYSAINIKNFYYLYYSASYQKYFSKIWYFAADVSGYYSNLKSSNYEIKNAGYTQQLSLSNYFTLKKLGQFGITSTYNTTDYADSYKFLPQFSWNIEYSKSIFKKNGSVNITFSDISNSLKDRFVYQINNFSVKDIYKYETRYIKLTLNYRFGNKSVKKASERITKSETEIDRLK